MEKFRCLQLAYEAIRQGGNAPCILNAANEVVNEAYRQNRCTFPEMADIIATTLQHAPFDATPTLETYLETDAEARRIAEKMIK